MPKKTDTPLLQAVVANEAGEIFELDGYAAVGRSGEQFALLTADTTMDLPHGSELMRLPDRHPVVYDLEKEELVVLTEDPFEPGQSIYPVAAFNSPGHVISQTSAFIEDPEIAEILPLFSYGAVGWHQDRFQSAALLVDAEPRQDLRQMPQAKIEAGVKELTAQMPKNRLLTHLTHCALTYGCPAAKNFFLGRFEAPLPTATTCNARCLGCLSKQSTDSLIPVSQNRIAFTPSPNEIAQIALTHIERVPDAVVSFGQGCEGDPVLSVDVIKEAIELIRDKTDQGTIHMNTNASQPDSLAALFDAGLDSIRVSLNSVRKDFYSAYFRPRGYTWEMVCDSIDRALKKGCFVAINYLNSPGFTDSAKEAQAFLDFTQRFGIHMIQWRNLNFDPLRYWAAMAAVGDSGPPMGMLELVEIVRQKFPQLINGYFNPPKTSFLHHESQQGSRPIGVRND